MRKVVLVYIYLLMCNLKIYAQFRDNVWVFGDSIKVTFDYQNNPIVSQGNMYAFEANASVSDSLGNLLFYSGSYYNNFFYFNTLIYNRLGSVMQNAGNIIGNGSATNGNIIIPMPGDYNKFYDFSNGRNTSAMTTKLYYNIVDMSLDSGRGAVIQKNIVLCDSFPSEQICAVKHGNGRDWWLIAHLYGGNEYITYLISPSGISGPIVQPVGEYIGANSLSSYIGEILFSPQGARMAHAFGNGNLQLFDFDRCTGLLSNYLSLGDTIGNNGSRKYGCSFSPRGNMLYVSDANIFGPDSLFQFDLVSPNIQLSKQLIYLLPDTEYVLGQHQLAENGKIYISNTSFLGYYPDSINTTLSVINNPDVAGMACNIMPFGFTLNGRRNNFGLPNNPNYNLGPLSGSVCDSLTVGLDEKLGNLVFSIYPNPSTAKFTIQLSKKTYGNFTISDLTGNILQRGVFNENSFNFDLEDVSSGIYILKLVNANFVKTIKLLKN